MLTWRDGNRTRTTTIYEGEDGIEAGVIYQLDEAGQAVRAWGNITTVTRYDKVMPDACRAEILE